MGKKRRHAQVSVLPEAPTLAHEHHRGDIKDNAIKALVTSTLFKSRVEKAKKGKGSYQRNAKHKGQAPYLLAA